MQRARRTQGWCRRRRLRPWKNHGPVGCGWVPLGPVGCGTVRMPQREAEESRWIGTSLWRGGGVSPPPPTRQPVRTRILPRFF